MGLHTKSVQIVLNYRLYENVKPPDKRLSQQHTSVKENIQIVEQNQDTENHIVIT